MTFEENRAFSADAHGIVKPLSDHYVAVTLDYWQIFWGNGSTKPGRFLQKYNFKGIDTAGQVVINPKGELVAGPRSWKTGKGFLPGELIDLARAHPADPGRKNALKLSWFMIDPDYYQVDLGPNNTSGYCSAVGAVTAARKVRRPLARVDGGALEALENHQEFLQRHVRQFWWQKGDAAAPARIVIMNVHETPRDGKATELTGACPPGKVPEVIATVELGNRVELEKVSPALDEAWRVYMTTRPSNAENLTFAKENIGKFKELDSEIRDLAKANKLLAPGGRKLFRVQNQP